MIREICKDEAFLAQKAEPATRMIFPLPPTYWKPWNIIRTAVSAWQPI